MKFHYFTYSLQWAKHNLRLFSLLKVMFSEVFTFAIELSSGKVSYCYYFFIYISLISLQLPKSFHNYARLYSSALEIPELASIKLSSWNIHVVLNRQTNSDSHCNPDHSVHCKIEHHSTLQKNCNAFRFRVSFWLSILCSCRKQLDTQRVFHTSASLCELTEC